MILPMFFFLKRLIIPFCCFTLFICCGDSTGNKDIKDAKIFRYNQSSGITSLDPAFAKDQANIWAINQLFNGLVQMNDRLEVIPAIAKSWEISPDGLTYTFHLRNDVYFHDHPVFEGGKGTKVTAADVAYSFGRIIDKDVASAGAWLFNDRVSVSEPFTAINDSTFQLKLKQPFRPMLGILTMQYCSVVPKKIVEHFGKTFRSNPVGTGPFKFSVWKENETLVLTANPNYFETNESGKRMPFIDGVKITFMENKRNAYLSFIEGKIDLLSGIDATYKDDLLTSDGELRPELNTKIQLLRSPYLNTEYLGIMLGKTGLSELQNKKVRQAINYAIHREQIVQYLRNNIGNPAFSGFVPKGLPSFDESAVRGFTYQPEKARQLLKEAGFENGKGLPVIPFETTDAYQDISTAIQNQLKEVGIQVAVSLNPASFLREKAAKGEAVMFRGSWIADYPDAESYFTFFYGKNPAPPNYTRFNHAEFNQLYLQSLTVNDDNSRYDIYRNLDKIILEEAPVVPLYYDEVLRFVHPRVKNLGINPLNLLHLKQVTL
ncbi:MAG: ABC transporter substrate-binding protein [Sphingobacteriales bacterium]|nr:MAG: ABC transporter substrate-binding protein [Sphingobacteriales bacterium]